MKGKPTRIIVVTLGLLPMLGPVEEGRAMEGLFPHAHGLRHKALAGAGAAAISDATGIMLNPAGLVGIGDQLNVGLSLFVPEKSFSAVDTVDIDLGDYGSRKRVYPVPMLAYVRQLDDRSAIAFSLSANSGLETRYPGDSGDILGTGPFRAGKAGMALDQLFLSLAYARHLDDRFRIGIAPVLAIQRFKAHGLSELFAGLSAYPDHVSGAGYSYAYGAGARFGVLWNVTDNFSLGATFQTKVWMSRFGKYRGLLADRGDLDMPPSLQVGIAYRLTPELQVMLDYHHVFYSEVKALANQGRDCLASIPSSLLGGSEGCGFHWRDTNTIRLGLEYQASDSLIVRLGYAYTFPNPVRRDAMLFNTLMPGTVRHEITGGASWRMNAESTLDIAFMYAPATTVSGPEISPWGGGSYGGWIRSRSRQFEVSVGWTYNFDAGAKRAQ